MKTLWLLLRHVWQLIFHFIAHLRPTPKLLRIVAGFAVTGLFIGAARLLLEDQETTAWVSGMWWLALSAIVLWGIYDAFTNLSKEQIMVKRVLPSSFALNRQQTIKFEIINTQKRALPVSLTDGVPAHFEGASFPLEHCIEADQKGVFEYTVIPKQRGLAIFAPAYLLLTSRAGLWQSLLRVAEANECKVYPDFSAVSNSFVFGVEQAMRNMGAHIAQRKGDGMEFNQLREFREGDTLKQVDWKATARLGSPISREYQEEKDQNVVFLLDCSRRMRAVERNLSYFDYALNALLMSSYIALDKGDAVGVMTFSGEPSWLSPVKGKGSINQLLNHLYALDTSTQSSDYVTAAEQLLLKHRKRSLIILITNVRDEDNDDLRKAVDILSQQHLVMVVALQERILEQVNELSLDNQSDLMLFAGVKYFEHARAKMLALLKASGVSVVDATHQNIQVQLVTEYLTLKKNGRI